MSGYNLPIWEKFRKASERPGKRPLRGFTDAELQELRAAAAQQDEGEVGYMVGYEVGRRRT